MYHVQHSIAIASLQLAYKQDEIPIEFENTTEYHSWHLPLIHLSDWRDGYLVDIITATLSVALPQGVGVHLPLYILSIS